MPVRKSEAEWIGTIENGKGTMRVSDGSYKERYSHSSRFKDGMGSNPEELIAAAHAGCYSMALSDQLEKANYMPQKINTQAEVTFDTTGQGPSISSIKLNCKANVPGINRDDFLRFAEAAKADCPVSKALTGTEITLKAILI
ncbi:OsmC family peroxiredoxin [Fodinibius halophilus]|uniref:OsmC family peroxiredoxin n=1 Tax=Fodinibius halophilus TaxID=1736908 RepID=A0A6M1TCM2_9BACT|nr:OsmC family peroxiredoxin [Fodinibius halophilus]NGP90123.1 OsmC family peroxiredoxin [Fodinibius halophilus]